MSAFAIKVIAILTMLIDHIGVIFSTSALPLGELRLIGRIAFPLFAFGLAQGYRHTSNIYKYSLRLGILAVVSQIPFFLFGNAARLMNAGVGFRVFLPHNWLTLIKQAFSHGSRNIVFTLLLGLLAIYVFDKLKDPPKVDCKSKLRSFFYKVIELAFRLLPVLAIAYVGRAFSVEYGLWGVLLMVGFYAAKDNKLYQILALAGYAVCYALPYIHGAMSALQWGIYLCPLLAAIPIFFYDGSKRGFKCAPLSYSFYPVHLLVLTFILWLV